MMSRPLGAVASLVCLAIFSSGCSPGSVGDSVGDESTTGGEASSTDEPTTAPPFEPIPARGGISIVRVEANSGVAVPIGIDGAEVGGDGRNAYLPRQRDTMIRAFVDVPDDWVEREIEGRLHLTGGGVDKVLTTKMLVESDSRDSGLDSTFFWGAPAELIVPGLKYSIELWEAAPGQETAPEGELPPRAPHTGTAFVGVEADPATMKIVVVPIAYDFGGCKETIEVDAWKQKFEDALLQQNPVGTMEMTWREPYAVNYDLTAYSGLSRLVSDMSKLRTSDGVGPNVYYYGFFDSCGACIGSSGDGIQQGCTVGLAADITGPDKSDAYGRASAGQLVGDPQGTFVHEVGHTQGRRHIECPGGNSAGNDPSYPYSNGAIGVWGFGIRDYRLRHPTTNYDYMSYCGSTWVSDWQWNATYTRIRTLTGWDSEGAPADDEQGEGLLIGAIDDGQQIWWSAPGSLADDVPRSATHAVDFVLGGRTVPVAAKVSVRPHGTTLNVVAPLPADFDPDRLDALVLRSPEGETEVDLGAVQWLHRPLDIAAP